MSAQPQSQQPGRTQAWRREPARYQEVGEDPVRFFSISMVMNTLVLWVELWSSAVGAGHERVKGGGVAAQGDSRVHSLAVR